MKSRIITFSSRGLGRGQEEILDGLERRLDGISKLRPDLVCFPEEVLLSGGDRNNPRWQENNAKALGLFLSSARELNTNIAVGLEEPSGDYPGKRYNTGYLIDRGGNIIGRYRKRHITFRAVGDGLPGERLAVADTDIGRIGLSVCFDIGWRDDWQRLAEMGARLVVWPSAYHGGNLLNAYAAVHCYNIVSSVWNAQSRVIDVFGNTIAESSDWDSLAIAEIDLGAEIFHFDRQENKIAELRAELGDRVSFRIEPRGNMFELSINDPALTMSGIKERFGLMSYRDYHLESEKVNDELRRQYPER